LIVGLLLLALSGLAAAQEVDTRPYTAVLRYNLTSASVIYCTGGAGFIQSPGSATTVGSSTTVTASAGTPFDPLSVGDAVIFGGNTLNIVVTKTSGSVIVLDAAINLVNPTGFRFMHFVCGSTINDGWLPMAVYGRQAVIVWEVISQTTASGIDVQVQCRSSAPDAGPVQVFPACASAACNTFLNIPASATGVTAATGLIVEEPWSQCRVGLKIDTTQTGPQSINVYLMGRK
jgi:hypothetical protein